MKTGAAGGMPVRANTQHRAPRTASAWGALATVFNIAYPPRWREPRTDCRKPEGAIPGSAFPSLCKATEASSSPWEVRTAPP